MEERDQSDAAVLLASAATQVHAWRAYVKGGMPEDGARCKALAIEKAERALGLLREANTGVATPPGACHTEDTRAAPTS